MALSQDEQRKLEALEEALLREDPRLARKLAQQHPRHSAVHLACFFFGGMILLLVGAVASQPFFAAGVLIAVAGYVAMVWSAVRWLARRSF